MEPGTVKKTKIVGTSAADCAAGAVRAAHMRFTGVPVGYQRSIVEVSAVRQQRFVVASASRSR